MSAIAPPPPVTAVPPDLGGVFDVVSDAHCALSDAQRAGGFEAGYRRAINDLLADLALVAAEVLRDQPADCPDVRRALREFRQRFERHVDGQFATGSRRSTDRDGYVDGGLGI